MKRHNVHTTLSSRHWELLKKYQDKYETQQKALEFALESLDDHVQWRPELSPEEELWLRVGKELKGVCIIQAEVQKFLLTAIDLERFKEFADQHKILEYSIEFYYHKPLKECSLKEVLDGLAATSKFSGLIDSFMYTDKGDFFSMKTMHDMGINNSKMLEILFERLFKTYGVKAEIKVYERSVFVNVFKNVRDQ